MPPVQSKNLSPEEEKLQEEQYKKEAAQTIRQIGPLVFMIVSGGQLLNQSRPLLVKDITKGDALKAAQILASFGGLGGAAEFALNPVIGRLSDRFGRRPLLLLSPVTCALLRGMVYLFPGSQNVIMTERVFSSAVVTGFFSTMRAMLNDKLKGPDLVIAGGQMALYAGSGVVLGPFLETFILKRLGARANFAAVALINICVALIMWKTAKETLPVEQQKPITVKDCSPLTFIEMLKVGSVNRRLMLILLLQSFGEGRVMQDINMLNLRDNLKWQPQEVSQFMSVLGMTIVSGGKTVKYSIEKLGMSGHTTMSNLTMALAFFLQAGTSKYFSQYSSLALWFLGGRKRDAVETLCSDLTLASTDMGKGQISSALSNFKSLGVIAGPPISGALYAAGQKRGWPGLPYQFIGVMYILAELVHMSLSPAERGGKK